MLSPLDDLSIHQVAETMASVGTTDKNFYDRYYFSLHGSTDEFFVIVGLGQYPNLDVTDAFLTASYGDKQTVIRASRPLGLDRLDTRVGPLRVEVLEGLQRLRVVCEETEGFALDAVWQGVVPAFEEPRMIQESTFGRQTLNTMRFLQTGTWSGTLVLDGRTIEVTPDRFGGNRDRSWGVRPVGEPEAGGKPVAIVNGMFWNYFMVRFADSTIAYMVQEDGVGRRTLEEAVRLFPDGRVEYLGRPEHDVRFKAGTRLATTATIRFRDGLVLEGEAVRPVQLSRGSGYGRDPDWKHGKYHGEEVVVQRRDFDLHDPNIAAMPGSLVDNLGRFSTNQGDGEGWGLLEVIAMGPHPQYFKAWDDLAP